MFTFLIYLITVSYFGTVTIQQRQDIREAERRIDMVWQDLLFTDYDHRVDLCHLQWPPESRKREQCVIQAYRQYCDTSKQCVTRRGR